MPALPAISFLGLRGTAAWLAAGAAGVGGLFIARGVVPSLVGGGARGGGSAAPGGGIDARSVDVIGALARALSESQGRVVSASFGPASSIALAGTRLASDVVDVAGRVAERSVSSLSDTTREITRSNTRQAEALIALVSDVVRPEPVRPPVVAPIARVESPAPATFAPAAPRPAASAPVVDTTIGGRNLAVELAPATVTEASELVRGLSVTTTLPAPSFTQYAGARPDPSGSGYIAIYRDPRTGAVQERPAEFNKVP